MQTIHINGKTVRIKEWRVTGAQRNHLVPVREDDVALYALSVSMKEGTTLYPGIIKVVQDALNAYEGAW